MTLVYAGTAYDTDLRWTKCFKLFNAGVTVVPIEDINEIFQSFDFFECIDIEIKGEAPSETWKAILKHDKISVLIL